MWWFRASVSSLQCSVLLSKTKFEEIFCIHHYWVKHCLEPLSSMFCTVIKDKNRRVFCNQHYCVKNYLEPLSPMFCSVIKDKIVEILCIQHYWVKNYLEPHSPVFFSVIKDQNRRDFLYSTLFGQELPGTALSNVLFCYQRQKSKRFFVVNIISSRITWNVSHDLLWYPYHD